MLILNVHPKYDCAAAGILLTENINEFTEHECYHIIGEETFLKHKSQLIIGRDDKKIQELAERADIIHLNKYDWSANTQLGFIEPYLESKTSIFHLHGNMDIWKPLTDPLNPINRAKKYNMKIVSCSPLTEKITDCEWMPNPVPTHAKEYLPVHKSWHRPLKIIHTVINKYNKGTEEIKEVLDYLKQKGQIDIEYQVLEGECSLEETLKTKQQHHVCIDNLTQGFIGMAGWEAMSQNLSCIARLDPYVKKRYEEVFGKPIPILDVRGIDEMAFEISKLAGDIDYRYKKAKESRKWMVKNYHPKKIAKIWSDFYEKL